MTLELFLVRMSFGASFEIVLVMFEDSAGLVLEGLVFFGMLRLSPHVS